MLLEDAIKMYEQKARTERNMMDIYDPEMGDLGDSDKYEFCREDRVRYLQLAAWLKELKQRREATGNIITAIEEICNSRDKYESGFDESDRADRGYENPDEWVRRGFELALEAIAKHTGELGISDEDLTERCKNAMS